MSPVDHARVIVTRTRHGHEEDLKPKPPHHRVQGLRLPTSYVFHIQLFGQASSCSAALVASAAPLRRRQLRPGVGSPPAAMRQKNLNGVFGVSEIAVRLCAFVCMGVCEYDCVYIFIFISIYIVEER